MTPVPIPATVFGPDVPGVLLGLAWRSLGSAPTLTHDRHQAVRGPRRRRSVHDRCSRLAGRSAKRCVRRIDDGEMMIVAVAGCQYGWQTCSALYRCT